jgi:nicotinamide mononucleotide transporter
LDLHSFFETIGQNFGAMKWPEVVSVIMQVASVWYARKNNILVYPTGIVGVLLAAWVYFFMSHPPVYADGGVNVYYFFMSVYGWYNWVKKKDAQHEAYPISWCGSKELQWGLGLFIVAWAVLYIVLRQLTNSNTPLLDSLTSASAITAMWWMAKRKIENWLAWIFSNIVAIPLNAYKGLHLFTLMYVLFLVMAWMGYREWIKKYRSEHA